MLFQSESAIWLALRSKHNQTSFTMQEVIKTENQHRIFDDRRFRYIAIGGWNTLAGCGIFAIFYYLLAGKIHYLAIAVLSHFIAVMQAWYSYRRLVFRSQAAWFSEYIRFNLSSLLLLALQMSGLWLLVNFLGLHPLFSQIGLIVVTAIMSYFIHRNFSFYKHK